MFKIVAAMITYAVEDIAELLVMIRTIKFIRVSRFTLGHVQRIWRFESKSPEIEGGETKAKEARVRDVSSEPAASSKETAQPRAGEL